MAACAGEIGAVIYDRAAPETLYNEIIDILNDITLLEWGWMAGRFEALYITSAQFPVTIGFEEGPAEYDDARPEPDIIIESLPKEDFADTSLWLGAVMLELKVKLTSEMHRIDDSDIRDTVDRTLWRACRSTTSDYAICAAEARYCGWEASNVPRIDMWMNDCLRDSTGADGPRKPVHGVKSVKTAI